MNKVGQIERVTQNRVVQLFEKQLGYTYLGNWADRPNNRNIEEDLLRSSLIERGYAIVHSLKNDPKWTEQGYREFFQARRRKDRGKHGATLGAALE